MSKGRQDVRRFCFLQCFHLLDHTMPSLLFPEFSSHDAFCTFHIVTLYTMVLSSETVPKAQEERKKEKE